MLAELAHHTECKEIVFLKPRNQSFELPGKKYSIINSIKLTLNKENITSLIIYLKQQNDLKDEDKKKFVFLTTEWNSIINKNFIFQPILQAEGYIYSVCNLYNV